MKLSIKLKCEKDYIIKLMTFVMPLVKHSCFSDVIWGGHSKWSGTGPLLTTSSMERKFPFLQLTFQLQCNMRSPVPTHQIWFLEEAYTLHTLLLHHHLQRKKIRNHCVQYFNTALVRYIGSLNSYELDLGFIQKVEIKINELTDREGEHESKFAH